MALLRAGFMVGLILLLAGAAPNQADWPYVGVLKRAPTTAPAKKSKHQKVTIRGQLVPRSGVVLPRLNVLALPVVYRDSQFFTQDMPVGVGRTDADGAFSLVVPAGVIVQLMAEPWHVSQPVPVFVETTDDLYILIPVDAMRVDAGGDGGTPRQTE